MRLGAVIVVTALTIAGCATLAVGGVLVVLIYRAAFALHLAAAGLGLLMGQP